MPKAIQITQPGGPEAMQLVEVKVGEPGPGEIRIRHHACGLNFIDVYQRTGLYPNADAADARAWKAPASIEAVGEGVDAPEGRRPRGLCQQPARALQRGARDAGEERRAAARRASPSTPARR